MNTYRVISKVYAQTEENGFRYVLNGEFSNKSKNKRHAKGLFEAIKVGVTYNDCYVMGVMIEKENKRGNRKVIKEKE